MMIGPIIAGTVAASDSSFGGFSVTPAPFYVDGRWWSFTSAIRSTAPRFGITSRVSTDGGETWVLDDTTYHASLPSIISEQLNNLFEYGNGLLTFLVGNNQLWSKDLNTPGSKWLPLSITSLGGFISNPVNAALYFDDINSLFILDLEQGRDIYTSADLATFASINGSSENPLNAIFPSRRDIGIRFAAGKYVASRGFEIASSPDLLTWTQEPNRVQPLFNPHLFKGVYIDYPDVDVFNMLTSTDLINWTLVPRANFVIGANTGGIQANTYQPRYVVITSSTYTLVGLGFILETTDGVTYTASDSAYNFTDGLITFAQNELSYLPFAARGRGCRMTASSSPGFALIKTLEEEELGGKILKLEPSLRSIPTLQYAQAGSGFTELTGMTTQRLPIGNAVNTPTMSDEAFTIADSLFGYGFYYAKGANRYFEVTVISGDGDTNLSLDVIFPSTFDSNVQRFSLYSGVGVGNARLEVSRAVVEDIPLPDYEMQAGQVIGFQANALFAQLTVFVDGVELLQVPNMHTSFLWKITLAPSARKLHLNIGQDPFEHLPAGAIAWATEYLP